MNEFKYIVQIGRGVDQHGHDNDCTQAAIKAIKNAISNNCLCGLTELGDFKTADDIKKMRVHVKIGVPFPSNINEKKVLRAVPFGEKTLEVIQGGMITTGVKIQELGDTSDNMIICNAAVEVYLTTNKIIKSR